MPNIREYKSQVNGVGGLQPTDRGVSALSNAANDVAQGGRTQAVMAERAGRSLESGVNALAQPIADIAETHYSKQDIIKYGADSAAAITALTAKWNDTRNHADPNDPLVAQRFNEEVLQPALSEFGKGYITKAGQQMALDFRTRMLDHFANVQDADQKIADRAAVEKNLVTMQNQNAVTLHTDPTSFDLVNENTHNTVAAYKRAAGLDAASNAHLDELEQGMLRTNARAAGRGMGDKNPDELIKAIDSGWASKYLTETDRQELRAYGEQQQREAKAAQRADITFKEHQDKEAADKALVGITTGLTQPDGTLVPNPQVIRDLRDKYAGLPGAESATYRAALGFANALQENRDNKFLPKTDAALREQFDARAALQPDDPNVLTRTDIFKAYTNNQLSDKEYSVYQNQLSVMARDPLKRDAYRQFNEWAATIKPSIDRSVFGGQADSVGAQAFGQFKIQARAAFEQAYEAGTWKQAITAHKGDDYIGNLAQPWQTSTQEQMRRMQTTFQNGTPILTGPITPPKVNLPEADSKKPPAEAGPSAAPGVQSRDRLPGESPEAWKKRIGG